MLKQIVLTSALVLLMAMTPAAPVLGQVALVREQVKLLEAPSTRASVVRALSPQQKVSIISRKGFWFEVEVDNDSGWLKMTHLTFAELKNFKGSLAALKTGRDGSGNNVAATGVRGLEMEAITLAQPDYEAFSAFQNLTIDESLGVELISIKEPKDISDVKYKRPKQREKNERDEDSENRNRTTLKIKK